jgi:hypothetical protein
MKRWLALFVLAGAASAQIPAINWEKNQAEILERYRALVGIDSRAGNETRVVEYLKKALEAEGIATETFALEPARANLVARLKGNGSKRPLLILAHTDVVGVQREKWPVDPFGAVMKDGYIWGRGSKDDKPVLAANLMTMLLLKRNNARLDRDVIFLAESGEEADTTGVGINFMVSRHFNEIDAEFALTRAAAQRLRAIASLWSPSGRRKRFRRGRGWWRTELPAMGRYRGKTTRSFTWAMRSASWANGKHRCA